MLGFRRNQEKCDRRKLAAIGEETAARLLASRGYRLLERNYRSHIGELDIVARQGKELVFVEVKSRTSVKFGRPAQNVSKTKQKKLAALARGYVAHKIKREVAWRFDIVEVLLTETGKVVETNIIAGAFRPD